MTCGIALRRVIIIKKESITLAIAMPRVARVTVLAAQRNGTVPGSKLTGRGEAIRTLEAFRQRGSADDLMSLIRL